MTTPAVQKDAFGALWGKGEAMLSGGAYAKPTRGGRPTGGTNVVHARNLSRYSSYKGTRDGTMAMGIVEALLSILAGNVRTVSCDGDALTGRVDVASVSSTTTYHFTWDARLPRRVTLGGFPLDPDGTVRPTYHAAVVVLVQHWVAWSRRSGGRRDPDDELLERWWNLLNAMGACFPRAATRWGWPCADVAASCRAEPATSAIRDRHEQVADTLWLHMKYLLPNTSVERELVVQHEPVIPSGMGYLVPLDPVALLSIPTAIPAASAAMSSDPDLDLANDPATREAVAAADAMVRGASSVLVETGDVWRIREAMQGEGAVFLLGPAGQGKTEWVKHLAGEYYDGHELIQLTGRIHEEDLYGTNVQDRDGRWTLAPGPVTRWAMRVAAGQRLALVLDELPRAHGSLRDGIMAVINTHSAADLAREGYPPPAEPGPYHLVCVPGHATYLLPARRVKIVATGNIGESYKGLDLSDPAFLDRWSYWIQVAPLTPDEMRQILSCHVGLPPIHGLFTALLAVSKEIDEYHDTNAGALRTLVTLRTLIRWGKAAAAKARASAGTWPVPPAACRQPLIEGARTQWLDKVCPMKGDRLDETAYAELLEIIQRAAMTLSPS